MTRFGNRREAHRRAVEELEPNLRDRMLALDEPVSRADWSDVVRRTKRSNRRATAPVFLFRRIPAYAAVAASVVSVVAGSALGILLASGGDSERPLAAAAPAPIATTHALFVSRTSGGGFCYEWTGGPGSCETKVVPLGISWGRRHVSGTVSRAVVSSVRIEFTDGTSATPEISWLSEPINAGFFVYDIPPGKTVTQIDAYRSGGLRAQVPWYAV